MAIVQGSRFKSASANSWVQAPSHRHSTLTIALHWASVFAIMASVVCGLWRELIEHDALRAVLLDLHRQFGLVVLLALCLRLFNRLRYGMASHAGELPALMRWAAAGSHLALYGALLAMPLLGVAVSQAHDVPVRFLGLLQLPALVPADADLADDLSSLHVNLAWALLALVTLHVAAACWHHLVRRDGVLAGMLPLVRRRR
jgi:cytochrome b561